MTKKRMRVVIEGTCHYEGGDDELSRKMRKLQDRVHDLPELELDELTISSVNADEGDNEVWSNGLSKAREALKRAYPRGLSAVRNMEAATKLEQAQHVLWMCDEVQALLSLDKREKAMRWLGFVQGSLWLLDLRTIAEMRTDNSAV